MLVQRTRKRIRSNHDEQVIAGWSEKERPLDGVYRGSYLEPDRIRREVKLHLKFTATMQEDGETIGGYEISGYGEYQSGCKPQIVEGFVNHAREVYWLEEGGAAGGTYDTIRVLTTGELSTDNSFAGAWSSSHNGRFDYDLSPNSQEGPSRSYTLTLDTPTGYASNAVCDRAAPGHDAGSYVRL